MIGVLYGMHGFLHAAHAFERMMLRLRTKEDILVFELLEHAKTTMREVSPRRTGAMASGWYVRRTGHAAGVLMNRQLYTMFQFTGTKGHYIGQKKTLTFFAGGSQIFLRNKWIPEREANQEMYSALLGEVAHAEHELRAAGFDAVVRSFPDFTLGGGSANFDFNAVGGGGP